MGLAQMSETHSVVLDPSETGTGKTYGALGWLEQLARRGRLPGDTRPTPVFIVSVKPVLQEFANLFFQWRREFRGLLEVLGVVNLELALHGKCYGVSPVDGQLVEKVNPWLTIEKIPWTLSRAPDKDSLVSPSPPTASPYLSTKRRFTWRLPRGTQVIWDEAHRARNRHSEAFGILSALLDWLTGANVGVCRNPDPPVNTRSPLPPATCCSPPTCCSPALPCWRKSISTSPPSCI